VRLYLLKKLSFIMTLIFSLQTEASSLSRLKEAFDELHFGLTVEWDQTDLDFKRVRVEHFEKTLSELAVKELTREELLEGMALGLKNERQKRDLHRVLELVDLGLLSELEAQELVEGVFAQAYSQGAQWSPAIKNLIVSGLVLGAFYLLREIYNRSRPEA
jgi:hypothetical protein